jgi:hypothetical protein
MSMVTTVCSIQQCLTGAEGSKTVGAALRTWHAPVIHPDPYTQARVDQMVQCDRRVTLRCVSEQLGISLEHVVVTQVLEHQRVSAVWVPKSLNDDQKATLLATCCGMKERAKNLWIILSQGMSPGVCTTIGRLNT